MIWLWRMAALLSDLRLGLVNIGTSLPTSVVLGTPLFPFRHAIRELARLLRRQEVYVSGDLLLPPSISMMWSMIEFSEFIDHSS